jgi:predicted nucleotidyltransferase
LDHLIILHVAGSRLYGINNEDSDWDIRGVVVPPKRFWVGAYAFELFEGKDPDKKLDFVIYDFRKWLNLTVAINPNVVETLFVKDNKESLLYTECFEKTRQVCCGMGKDGNSFGILNRRAYVAYHGYSVAQMKKMVIKYGNKTGRREIVNEHGFDVKFASHGFRLASQGSELLRTGHMTFPRPDKENLKLIRQGKKYGPDELDKCVADLELAQKDLTKALEESPLPDKADRDKHNSLLIDVYDNYVHKGA